MSRVSWLNALLLATVVGLGTYLYFKPARNAPAEYPLSALKPQEVKSIRVERAGAPPLVIERRESAWHVAEPFAARADALRVQQLLAILDAKSTHRLPAAGLDRFELERPEARLTLAGQSFGFGMVSPITREQYVLTGGAVYPIHPRYGAALPGSATDAVSRLLFAADEMPVRIELKDFAVEQRDGRWALTPRAGDLSQDDLIRWVDEWQLAAALRVEPHAKGKARAEIQVRLKGGGGFSLGVLAREPELVLARSDEKLQYHFRAGLAQRLLSPPSAAGDDAVKKK